MADNTIVDADNVKSEFKNSCELCFASLDDISECEVIDETFIEMMKILWIKSAETVMKGGILCSECTSNLRQAFEFKSACIDTEDILAPFTESSDFEELDLAKIFQDKEQSDDGGEAQKFCRLCRGPADSSTMISLSKLLEKADILEVFEKHIPEMNLKLIKDPFVCHSCHQVLLKFSKFLTTISDANTGMFLADHKLPQTKSFPTPDKPTFKLIFRNGQWTSIKVESVDQVVESDPIKRKNPVRRNRPPRKMDTCEVCGFKTRNMWVHRKTHKDLSEVKTYKCSECSYVSKHLSDIKLHMKRHVLMMENKAPKSKLHQCQWCPFTTLDYNSLYKHTSTHTERKPHEMLPYRCPHCNYGSRKQCVLDFHMQKHRPENAANKRKCPLCNYWTRFKNHLRRHMEYHDVKNGDEIKIKPKI